MFSILSKSQRRVPSCISPPYQYRNLALLIPLLRSSLSTQTPTQTQPPKELPFIAQYLISSFAFSSDRALKVSAHSNLAPIKSPARPQAVVKFLHDTGLTDAQIKAVVSLHPILLGYNVDKTFKPKVRELIDGGCSQELLVQLIRYNPHVLYLKDTHSRLLFWRDYFGNSDDALFKIIPKNIVLFTLDINKQILPCFNLLKEFGFSNLDILSLLQHGTRVFSRNLDSLRHTLELIEELGPPKGSKMFLNAVKAVGGITVDVLTKKVEFLKRTYGWSQEDVISAFRKYPTLLHYSENKMESNMDFLIREAGFMPRSIASYPLLTGSSLERVLIPRYTVLRALEDKGMKKNCSLNTACTLSERRFCERYVVPFEKDVPGLGEAYVAAFGVNLPK